MMKVSCLQAINGNMSRKRRLRLGLTKVMLKPVERKVEIYREQPSVPIFVLLLMLKKNTSSSSDQTAATAAHMLNLFSSSVI